MSSRRWRLAGRGAARPRPPRPFLPGSGLDGAGGGVPSGQPPLPGRRGGGHDRHLFSCAPGAGGASCSPRARCRCAISSPRPFVGFMTGLLVPRAGEVVRPYLISRRHPIRTSAGFASIILERLLDVVTVLLLFALYLYVLPTPALQTKGPAPRLSEAGGRAGGAGRRRRPGLSCSSCTVTLAAVRAVLRRCSRRCPSAGSTSSRRRWRRSRKGSPC
jgi:hypothetical protein